MLIPFGVDRLPRDPQSRSVQVGDRPLRLNTEAVPADAMPPAVGDHAARFAAAREWLESQCGDYAPLRRQFIAAYLRFVAAEIDAHRDRLVEQLKPYDGLYAPEDFFWSALRPLPRGWVQAGEKYLPADMLFWDGTRAIAIEISARETDRQKALLTAGIAVHRIEPDALPRLSALLPGEFGGFWTIEPLPSSPFRRPAPSPPQTTGWSVQAVSSAPGG